MRIIVHIMQRLALVAAFAAAVLLGGCAGVELEGPGFEALGISGNQKTTEPKVPDRAPLLIPPDRARLPQPQQSTVTASARPQNWPTDPDVLLRAEKTEAGKKEQDYRDKGDWSKDADSDEFDKLMDPMERSPGIFGGGDISNRNRSSKNYEN